MSDGASSSSGPASITDDMRDKGVRTIISNYVNSCELKLIDLILRTKKDEWRGNKIKEREVRNAIKKILGKDGEELDKLFELVNKQSEYGSAKNHIFKYQN